MELLDGRLVSREIKKKIKIEVKKMVKCGMRPPHLAAVLVGDDPASQVYVRNKVRACERVGFKSTLVRKGADISESELLQIISDLNQDPEIDGFIVQLPLPRQINDLKVTMAIDPRKDVDGFHPMNVGRMSIGLPAYLPATPYGIMQMLDFYNIDVEGKDCVVLGRSNIVGTPISILLSRKAKPGNATVIMTHSRTKDIRNHCKNADVLVVALGIPEFVTADMVKEGAIIVDVGINRVEASEMEKGYKLVGDVKFDEVSPKCSFITPVPGGVGPMTITSLLMNTLKAARKEIYD